MANKKVGLGVLVVGVVLIVAALVVKMVLLPSMAVFPDDVDTVRKYEGTLHTMLNPAALETMDLANLFLNEVPVTIDRHVTTEEVDGNKAIVLEAAVMSGPAGPIQASDTWYAIDRKTMNAIPDFSGNDKIIDREGLVIGFPIGTEKKDYVGWNGDTLSTTTAEYTGEEVEIKGLNTYVFEGGSPAREIVDPEMLAIFPQAIPKDLFLQLAGGIEVPEVLQGAFALILPNLPDPLPLKYTYEYETRYWVEPDTGVLIDYNKREIRKVAIAKDVLVGAIPEGAEVPEDAARMLPMLPDPLPLLEVFDLEYHAADSSIDDAAKDAKDAKGQLDLYGTTLPLILIVLGVILGAVGLVLLLRKGGTPAE
jgi:hypothetical protein